MAVCIHTRANQFVEICIDATDSDYTDSAGQPDFLVANPERVLADVINELLSPYFRVSYVASFEQHHNASALEAASDVPRMHAFANFFCKLRQNFFSIENANVTTHL